MIGIGYITVFWFNLLGLVLAWKLLFAEGGNVTTPGVTLLNFHLAVSFSLLLAVLSLVALTCEPALRKGWVYLFLAAPTICLIAVAVSWTRPEGV